MTLSTRNKMLLFFSIFTVGITAFFSLALIIFFTKDSNKSLSFFILPDLQNVRQFFTAPNTLSPLFALIMCSVYVPIVGFAVYFNFEKTQATEIIYFAAILLGFFAESLRLCIPVFDLFTGQTAFLRFIGRASFFGQMQFVLSILAQSVLSASEDAGDSDKHLKIISIVSVIFALTIPIDTTTVQQSLSVRYGFMPLFSIIRIIFISISFFALLFSSKSQESADYKKAIFALLLLCIGYILLLYCTTFFVLAAGTSFLITGTAFFLQNMHRYYMWK